MAEFLYQLVLVAAQRGTLAHSPRACCRAWPWGRGVCGAGMGRVGVHVEPGRGRGRYREAEGAPDVSASQTRPQGQPPEAVSQGLWICCC